MNITQRKAALLKEVATRVQRGRGEAVCGLKQLVEANLADQRYLLGADQIPEDALATMETLISKVDSAYDTFSILACDMRLDDDAEFTTKPFAATID